MYNTKNRVWSFPEMFWLRSAKFIIDALNKVKTPMSATIGGSNRL
jgi:hypothetical protein